MYNVVHYSSCLLFLLPLQTALQSTSATTSPPFHAVFDLKSFLCVNSVLWEATVLPDSALRVGTWKGKDVVLYNHTTRYNLEFNFL